jgi:hypothetical protein
MYRVPSTWHFLEIVGAPIISMRRHVSLLPIGLSTAEVIYLGIVSTSTFTALEYWSLPSRSSLRMSKIHLSICSLPWRRQKWFGLFGDVREPLGRRRGGILLEDNTTKALGLMVPAPTVLKQIKAATGVEWVVIGGGGRACRAHRRELKMELAWFWDVCLFVVVVLL